MDEAVKQGQTEKCGRLLFYVDVTTVYIATKQQ